jgi:hypothetical protein
MGLEQRSRQTAARLTADPLPIDLGSRCRRPRFPRLGQRCDFAHDTSDLADHFEVALARREPLLLLKDRICGTNQPYAQDLDYVARVLVLELRTNLACASSPRRSRHRSHGVFGNIERRQRTSIEAAKPTWSRHLNDSSRRPNASVVVRAYDARALLGAVLRLETRHDWKDCASTRLDGTVALDYDFGHAASCREEVGFGRWMSWAALAPKFRCRSRAAIG